MNKEQFVLEVRSLGIEVTEKKLKKLDEFYNLLILWNEKINLTTITAIQDVYLKHFYDSLTLFRVCDLTKDINICDVGSGAGFPGIVLKIFFPNLKITLVDSLNKRVNYLNTIIKELGLVNIEAVHSRMEDFSKVNEEKYDIITARAVANLSVLSEISVKALKIQGFLYGHLQHFTPACEFKSSLPRQEKQEKTLRFPLLFCFLKQPSLRYPAQTFIFRSFLFVLPVV